MQKGNGNDIQTTIWSKNSKATYFGKLACFNSNYSFENQTVHLNGFGNSEDFLHSIFTPSQ